MVEFIIIISLMIVCATFFILSLKEKNFFNVLTPGLILLIPGRYIFELIHIYYYGYSGSLFGYLFCYLTYTLNIVALAFVYLYSPVIKIKLPFNQRSYGHFLPYVIILSAFFLYLPVLIEFREYIFSPREIYMMTRTGYGVNYFLSSTLMYIAFILFLFKKALFKTEKLIIFIVCLIFAILHGSKGQIIVLLFIFFSYKTYVHGLRIKLVNFTLYIMMFSMIILSLFNLSLYGAGENGLVKSISSYADYTRNAIQVIDSGMEPLYGRLTLEDAIYSRIPRAIYPDKPKDFGNFYLGKVFYSEWFYLDTGSPNFGIGVQYADFGLFSIFYHLFWSLLIGILLKLFVTRLRTYKDPSDFIMVLFLTGVGLIPLGAGYLLPEHFFLAYAISILSRLSFFAGTRRIHSELR